MHRKSFCGRALPGSAGRAYNVPLPSPLVVLQGPLRGRGGRRGVLNEAYCRRNLQGVPVPHFLEWGYRTPPTFQDEKVNNLLLSAVNRGDLRRLNYNKTVTLSQTQSRMGGEYLLPILLHPSSWNWKAPRSPSELVPPLFRPKLRLWKEGSGEEGGKREERNEGKKWLK